MTVGEDRIRIKFNPNANTTNTLVDEIKQKTAELIDLCDEHLKEKDGRLAALAMTHYEDAAMWAVKAATT